MVMLHFILCSLSYTDTWQTIPESAIVHTILNLGCYVVEIFALILLFYTNGFLMKRRKREFGLYNVLGMEKRHIGRVLFWGDLFCLQRQHPGGPWPGHSPEQAGGAAAVQHAPV